MEQEVRFVEHKWNKSMAGGILKCISLCSNNSLTVMALLHCRTRIPNVGIGDWGPSLDLCNVNFQHITLVVKGKTLRIRVRIGIRVRQCKRAISVEVTGKLIIDPIDLYSHCCLIAEKWSFIPYPRET